MKIYVVSRVIDDYRNTVVKCFIEEADAQAYMSHINNQDHNDLKVVEHDLVEDLGEKVVWHSIGAYVTESTNFTQGVPVTTKKVVVSEPRTHGFYLLEGPQTDPYIHKNQGSLLVKSKNLKTAEKAFNILLDEGWGE